MQTSSLLGNYEFYYLAGLLKKLFRLDLTEELSPDDMYAKIKENLPGLKPQDEKEAYLLQLVTVFKPLEEYDEQMKELFRWGETEEYLWQVKTPVSR